ncbi:MAG: HAMP domain-containing protein, partial [Pseudomonadota bacterium]
MKNGRNSPSQSTPPASASITHRLTIFYTLSAFGMLAVTTGFLYYALVSSLSREDSQFLIDKVNDLRMLLKEHPEDRAALDEEINEGADFQCIKHYTRLLDEEGHVLMETQEKKMALSTSFFPRPADADREPLKAENQRSADGKTYLLLAAWANRMTSDKKRLLIQVALDVSTEEDIIRKYRKKIVIALTLGILFSAGAGIFIARRGMRPLGEITRVVQRIRATQLSDRVNPSQWPQELTALATSFDEMLTRLEDSFTRLSQFSSDLAHEL